MSLLQPFTLRGLELRNRIVVSPMCQYSAHAGLANDWHLVHLGARAVGGAGLVFCEASAVAPEGRITPSDTGIWNDAQADAWARVAEFVKAQGAMVGMQLAHAGRKASTAPPWHGGLPLSFAEGGWQPVAPSALAFAEGYAVPDALDAAGIAAVVDDFRAAAERSLRAGFEVLEVHAAHGYLLHQFLSPLSNARTDRYGGSLENRARLLRQIVAAVRALEPASLWVRVSATDWVEGGWDIEECVQLARWLKDDGVDVVDCSSGGNVPHAHIPTGPGYQVPFAARVRREAGIATSAVGLIDDPQQAQAIIERGDADLVMLAREMLRDPYFAYRAGRALRQPLPPPAQYERAW